MSFEWLQKFQQNMVKAEDYADKKLASYRLGLRAKGSIAGVSIAIDPDGCAACQRLDPDVTYHPDEAPHIPLPECDRQQNCRCVYRPVMTYQMDDQE